MKYILMMTGTKAGLEWYPSRPKDDLPAKIPCMRAFSRELKDSGVFVATVGLSFPDQTIVVCVGDAGEPVTERVFLEAKEFLAGYWNVDVESPEQAHQIAARASAVQGREGSQGSFSSKSGGYLGAAPKEFL